MAARKIRGTKQNPWPQQTKDRIKTSMLINRLQDHVDGKVELSSTQVTAALGLLKKTVADQKESTDNLTISTARASDHRPDLTGVMERIAQDEERRKAYDNSMDKTRH